MSISVALCTFDGAAHVEEQLSSILRQSLPVDEIVLADDGSRDDTVERVRRAHARSVEAGESGSVLTVLAPGGERLGVRRNVERALRATRTDVVLLADQDDRWHSDKVERAITALDADAGAVVVGSNARVWRPEGGGPLHADLFATLRVPGWERVLLGGPQALHAVVRRNVVPGMTLAIRRDFLADALPIPVSWPHDAWLVALAAATGGLRVDPTPRVDYRMHASNVVGVARRTPGYYLRRLTDSPRTAERNVHRYVDLDHRLATRFGAGTLPSDARGLTQDKLAFERARQAYPSARPLRVVPVLRALVRRQYGALAPNRSWDALRDLALRATV